MKHIQDYIYNKMDDIVVEHADSKYRKLFGRDITYSQSLKNKLISAGLDFRHINDRFVIYEDGCFEYTNPHLFSGTICAKLYKDRINRYINATDTKLLRICTDDAVIGSGFDLSHNPFNYIRAVLNALTNRDYTDDSINIVINDIDYTRGDYATDSAEC